MHKITVYFFYFEIWMDSLGSGRKRTNQNNLHALAVLNQPAQSTLISMPSPSPDYQLYHQPKKKLTLACSRIQLPKSKLYANLQIFEWRHHTEFPFIKTRYVSIKDHFSSSLNIIELQIYNEHCPLKLNHIFEMTLGQCLYLLKESIVGFERLYNRFGGFDICETMIAVNEKGFCRIWLNENYSSNNFTKNEAMNEKKMIHKIITLIEYHSQESKGSKKLFSILSSCSSFLSALKIIESYIMTSKVVVPSRYIFISTMKDVVKVMNNVTEQNFPSIRYSASQQSSPVVRLSIKTVNRAKRKTQRNQEQSSSIGKGERQSPSPLTIKRFKSEDRILEPRDQPIMMAMKISDGETTHTHNMKDLKISLSNRGSNNETPQSLTLSKTESKSRHKNKRKWIQDSSYIMSEETSSPMTPHRKKKQLTHSQAFQFEPSTVLKQSDRKYSINLVKHEKFKTNAFNGFYNAMRQSQNDNGLISQFSQLLQDEKKASNYSPRINHIIEEETDRVKEDRLESVLKLNGWTNRFTAVLEKKKLNESFHEKDKETPRMYPEVKLEKLGSMGRREVAMSILPEECEEV